MNLKTRVEKLEAASPHNTGNACLVIHGGSCELTKAEAMAKFLEQNGHAPDRIVNVHFIDPATKLSPCDCGSYVGIDGDLP